MENILTAIIVIFIILFAALTLSYAVLNAQTMLMTVWQATADRMDEQARTNLMLLDMTITGSGSWVELSTRNTGSTRLADFEHWDVIVQYEAETTMVVSWLPYTANMPMSNEWNIAGIYTNSEHTITEIYEPNILNPGEEAQLAIHLSPPVAAGKTVYIALATQTGTTITRFATRNLPPVLAVNTGISMTSGRTGIIDKVNLLTTDTDNSPSQLIYTVTQNPSQGSLTPAATFTQAQLDAGLVSYSHTGSQDDHFEFTVSDGVDVIGVYTFDITAKFPPMLITNPGFNLPAGATGFIQAHLLETIDPDTPPEDLIYTVITPPVRGSLNLGQQFTQHDINTGALTYTHAGGGSDSFQFTVSDGTTLIGSYSVIITINP